MQITPLLEKLFSFDMFSYKALLDGVTYPWEMLNNLNPFIDSFKDLGKIESEIDQGVFLNKADKIYIGSNVKIYPGATIEGPCILSDGCEIRPGAFVRAYTILGSDTVVGHCSEVKGSIFMPHAKAPHFNYVGDSVLGSHVNLGAGVKCANLRLDQKPVIFVDKDRTRIDTQREKLGVILGDGCQVGCQAVFNPGIVLKKKTLIRPLTSVTRSNISICYASSNN